MQNIIDHIHQCGNNGNREKDLDQLAKKLKDAKKVFSKHKSQLLTALGMLDPTQHSYGYCSIAHYLAELDDIPGKQTEEFLSKTREFLLHCNPHQIARLPHKFATVARKYGDLMRDGQTAKQAILPLRTAIEYLQRGNRHLITAVHPAFVLCCIKSKCYHAALPVIDHSIFEVNSDDDNPFDAKDNLLYHYYAGIVFIGCKRRARALECLQMALTSPSQALSSIQVECFKKYILLSLLVHGKVVDLPRFTSPPVLRHVDKLAMAYMELADAYGKGFDHMHQVITIYAEKFLEDQNFGLVSQVAKGLVRRNIKNLTDTYLTLSLEDIAKASKAGSAKEAEQYIASMIEEGEIFANIDQHRAWCRFWTIPKTMQLRRWS